MHNKRFQLSKPLVTPRAEHGLRQPTSQMKPTLCKSVKDTLSLHLHLTHRLDGDD